MLCPVCGNEMNFCNKDYENIPFYSCDCGMGASEPSDVSMYDKSNYFDDFDGNYSEEQLADNLLYLELIKKYSNGKKMLDVGAGKGTLLYLAKKQGFDVEGTDVSEYTCNIVPTKIGVKMHHGFLEDIKFHNKYDVISMNHVLEHAINPQKMLETAKELLAKTGILFIVVPNYKTLSMKIKNIISKIGLTKKPFKYLSCFHHNWFFSLETLEKLGHKAGLKTIYKTTISSPGKNQLYHSVLRKYESDNWLCIIFKADNSI